MGKFALSMTGLFIGASGMVFADGAEAASRGQFWPMLLMIGVAIAFFYLIVLRPERKRRRALEEKRSAMKKGDKITTTAGIMGTIQRVQDATVILKLYDGAKMEVLKAAISDVNKSAAFETQEEPAKEAPIDVELADQPSS